ncbi:uncharacterized protein LOC124337889 [Daphnia pulicaria]|uniref:uncharacterized protein LOC124337889 n=1 Tax=Daphnia pulicaria TaxID=35523 RepID=UPI001EEB445E|nr:uncharacterized protein LOC124337889 [Daphnia pulicaria]
MSVSNQSRKDHSDGSDGSDSDATTTSSTEHLTREEKLYVLRHTARQEPQGQESKSWQQLQQQRQSRPSCRSCSGLQLAQHQQHQQRSGSVNPLEQSMNSSGGGPDPASSCRTLIIHGSLSDESWARLAGTGSIPDLGLAGSSHYLTSTPKTPPFRPASSDCNDDAEDLLLLGSADRRRRRGGGHPPPPPPSPPGVGGFTTRSLPRSAKDFSALSTYQRHHPSSHLTSLASLYHEEQENTELDHQNGCCERRKHLKMLHGLAREMNWSLPITTTNTTTAAGPSDSCYPLSIEESGEGACSALSISDTLLNDHQTLQTPSSYTRDFTYLSKPPPAYPRNKSFGSGAAPATAAAAAVATENGTPASSRNSSSSSSCRRIKIRRALSRSHPDLSKLGKELGWNKSSAGTSDSSNTWRALRHNKTEPAAPAEELNTQTEKSQIDPPIEIQTVPAEPTGPATIAISGDKVMVVRQEDSEAVWSTPELVDAILEENFKLRQQVQNHQDHIAKLQKFEKELSAVQVAHQALVRSSERKESLEQSARIRLEAEWRRAQDMNAGLRNQVELLTSQLALRSASVASLGSTAESASAADWQNQIARRDALIAQLVSQNKELMTNKERQDIELCAQKATLQQQRSHIEILESALGRAQQNVNRLEDEFRRLCNGDSRHLLASAGVESNASAQAEPAAHREMANMEIRIRDLEAKLSEKEMLIHLLQRASMDREIAFGATRGLPESVSLLNRYPSQQQQSSQPQLESHLAMNLATSTTNGVKGAWSGSSGVSSLPSSSRGSAISVASNNSPSRAKVPTSSTNAPNTSAASDANPSVASQNNGIAETAQSLDNQLRALDRFYQNKQSLIQALQSDKERFPNNYWPS